MKAIIIFLMLSQDYQIAKHKGKFELTITSDKVNREVGVKLFPILPKIEVNNKQVKYIYTISKNDIRANKKN